MARDDGLDRARSRTIRTIRGRLFCVEGERLKPAGGVQMANTRNAGKNPRSASKSETSLV
jgi:hypothetical protein